ncbi:MAG: molybdopterin-dependent oxidoreductase [Chloroflexi bacterium]|nr:molybdopterin-dependent oxidoreductase [Chloroflexota bacterium]
MPEKEQIIPTICKTDCGGECVLKVHVLDGVVTRIETDDSEDYQYRACVKGRSQRLRMYSPDRLKYPLRRVGERGEGEFERISWDEALDTVAGELKRVYRDYGAPSVLLLSGGGDQVQLHHTRPMNRLLCLLGGYTGTWGGASFEGADFASRVTYGTNIAADTPDSLLHSRMIIMWGLDVANTIHHTNTRWFMVQAKEKGARIVSVDPKYTDSTATFAQQWIPIRPSTDTAMLIAMAYVIITENLHDQPFVEKYTVGFDQFKAYVTGIEDGVAKTPAWAEAITGVPAEVITGLAREFAANKPAALMPGWGAGHTANGEQFHRACMVLAAITGNVGVKGGNSGAGAYGATYHFAFGRALAGGGNPVDQAPPSRNAIIGSRWPDSGARVHNCKIWDAILEGKKGGYYADYKLLYLINSNYLNQRPNINKGVKAMKKLEFVVAQEQFLSPTARFADIVLPMTYFMERNDLVTGEGTPFYGFMNKVIEPYYETRSHLEIASALAQRLGHPEFNDLTEEELLKQFAAGSKDISNYETLKERGIQRVKHTEPRVAFREQIEDIQKNPFPTPSGKIEIYSQQIADAGDPMIPPVPKYLDTWESLNDPLVKKYPLQLITTHPKLRVHSRFHEVPWLAELERQSAIINTSDAEARGIKDGDLVRVFNDRGVTVLPAKVTERIMPGVVDIPEGAWYAPDHDGIDRGGCCNVLTRDEPSPAGAFAVNTCLVEVQKEPGGK